ncbi:MAG: ORF6N domain-containing protein [Bacteroidota bacterium]
MTNNKIINRIDIENRIFTARGFQVMLDSHLAELYGVETKLLNRAVKRNIGRFPADFMFLLNEEEWESLRFHIGTSKIDSLRFQNGTLNTGRGQHRKYLPYVFTEQGVAMLSAVLKSETAVKMSIQIMQAFVEMRKFIADNAVVFHRLDKVERKQIETDEKFDRIFTALEKKELQPEKGIFFDGQIYDAYSFIANLIRNAGKSIILVDNYIDDTVLTLFIKRKKGVQLTIYTKALSKQLQLDISKHNAQYEPVQVKELKQAHDRFLIIDEKELYHIGASLKDLGKKWFAFSKMDTETLSLLKKLKG